MCKFWGARAERIKKIITKYGDEFTVAIRQLDFPSQKTFSRVVK